MSFARGDSAVCTSLESSSLNCHSVLHCVTGASLDSRDFQWILCNSKNDNFTDSTTGNNLRLR